MLTGIHGYIMGTYSYLFPVHVLFKMYTGYIDYKHLYPIIDYRCILHYAVCVSGVDCHYVIHIQTLEASLSPSMYVKKCGNRWRSHTTPARTQSALAETGFVAEMSESKWASMIIHCGFLSLNGSEMHVFELKFAWNISPQIVCSIKDQVFWSKIKPGSQRK